MREVEPLPLSTEGGGRGKRDRKQTKLFDPVEVSTPTRVSPVQLPESDETKKQEHNASFDVGRRKRSAPQRLSPDLTAPNSSSVVSTQATIAGKKGASAWPATWKKLFDRVLPVPQICLPVGEKPGLQEPSYMRQMRGSKSHLYTGRPMRVLVEGLWESAVLSSLEEVEGKLRVMLSTGKEEELEAAHKAGRMRFDDHACGQFAVGRHAQVKFDGESKERAVQRVYMCECVFV